MTRHSSLGNLFLAFAVLAAASCGHSDGGSGAPTAPSTPALNLSGTWSGTFAEPGSTNSLRAAWTAGQSGTSVTGAFVLDRPDQAEVKLTGTLAGALSGSQLTLTLTMPAGAFASLGAPSSCSATGTGTSAATTATSISSTLTVTFHASCVGTFTPSATSTQQLTLTK